MPDPFQFNPYSRSYACALTDCKAKALHWWSSTNIYDVRSKDIFELVSDYGARFTSSFGTLLGVRDDGKPINMRNGRIPLGKLIGYHE